MKQHLGQRGLAHTWCTGQQQMRNAFFLYLLLDLFPLCFVTHHIFLQCFRSVFFYPRFFHLRNHFLAASIGFFRPAYVLSMNSMCLYNTWPSSSTLFCNLSILSCNFLISSFSAMFYITAVLSVCLSKCKIYLFPRSVKFPSLLGSSHCCLCVRAKPCFSKSRISSSKFTPWSCSHESNITFLQSNFEKTVFKIEVDRRTRSLYFKGVF